MDDVLAQHPPAVKVGGRRLSTSKPRHHPHHEQPPTEIAVEGPTDYPRPNPPPELINPIAGDEDVEQQLNHIEHQHAHYDEEVPKNEKKQLHHRFDAEKKLRSLKLDINRPTRDNIPATSGVGKRIDQPAGRGFIA